MKVLIIDDSKAVHAFLDRCLEAKGVERHHVYNGQEALDHLATATGYDLILLDWEMPVLDGPTTFDRLAAAGNMIPVMMMTTKNAPAEITLMLGKGVSEYMLKPFTADVLFQKLEMVLGWELNRAA